MAGFYTIGIAGDTSWGSSDNTTRYLADWALRGLFGPSFVDGVSPWTTTEPTAGRLLRLPVPGVLSDLIVGLGTAPGAGKSRGYTVRVNGVDSSLSVTIADTAVVATNFTTKVAVSAGDVIGAKSTGSGTPTASSTGILTMRFTPTVGWSTFRRNVAMNSFTFAMYDTAGQPKTGLAVAAQRSLDGGSFATCTNTVTEIGNGAYKINLSASDLDGATGMLRFSATGAVDTLIGFVTVP